MGNLPSSDHKSIIPLRQKIALIGLGLLFTLIIVEITLNICGSVILSSKTNSFKKDENGQKIVLCLGDSFVFGEGASRGGDFPSRLELLLQSKLGKNAVIVINKGVPGWNSSMLANRFEDNIRKYRPSVVIILVGSNDDWNPAELDDDFILTNKWKAASYLEGLFYRVKTFRLMGFILQGIKNKITGSNRDVYRIKSGEPNAQPIADSEYASLLACGYRHYFDKQFNSAACCFYSVIKRDPHRADGYVGLANIFHKRGKFEKSIRLLKKAIKIEPNNLFIYQMLSIEYGAIGQYDNGFKVCLSALKIDKNDMRFWLALFQFAEHRQELIIEAKAVLAQLGSPEIEKHLQLKKDIYKRVFLKNIERMVASAKENGKIKVILCNYPHSQCSFNDDIPKVNRLLDVTTVNLQDVFTYLRKKNGDDYYFIPDNHCNDRGYEAISRILLPYVETAL
jgi:tetratricopeptide (TPR) repeat protein